VELTIMERILTTGILKAKEGNFATLKALRTARQALEIDEEDHRAAEMEQNYNCPKCGWTGYFPIGAQPRCAFCATPLAAGTQLKWDPTAPPREMPLGEIATAIIAGHLRDLDRAGKLTDDLLSLYEKVADGG